MEGKDDSRGLQAVNNRFSLEWDGDVLHVRPTHLWDTGDADEYQSAYRAMVQLGCDSANGWFKCVDLRSLRINEADQQQVAELRALNAWSSECGLRGVAIIDTPSLSEELRDQVKKGYGGVGVPIVIVGDPESAQREIRRMRRQRQN